MKNSLVDQLTNDSKVCLKPLNVQFQHEINSSEVILDPIIEQISNYNLIDFDSAI